MASARNNEMELMIRAHREKNAADAKPDPNIYKCHGRRNAVAIFARKEYN